PSNPRNISKFLSRFAFSRLRSLLDLSIDRFFLADSCATFDFEAEFSFLCLSLSFFVSLFGFSFLLLWFGLEVVLCFLNKLMNFIFLLPSHTAPLDTAWLPEYIIRCRFLLLLWTLRFFFKRIHITLCLLLCCICFIYLCFVFCFSYL